MNLSHSFTVVYLLSANSQLTEKVKSCLQPVEVIAADNITQLLEYLKRNQLNSGPAVVDFDTIDAFDPQTQLFLSQIGNFSAEIYGVMDINKLGWDYKFAKRIFSMGIINYFTPNRLDDLVDALLLSIHNGIKSGIKKGGEQARLNVAIVDDCVIFLDSLTMHLDSLNLANISSFKSGEELVEHGFNFDLYIIDIVLCEISGLSLIQSIRNSEQGTPNPAPNRPSTPSTIIAMSNLETPNILSLAIRSGANFFVKKPITVQAILKNVLAAAAQKKVTA